MEQELCWHANRKQGNQKKNGNNLNKPHKENVNFVELR